ncbi:hypothetical protein [Propionivibrio sp.]|uniref:hypothetical protein n=1 Tax=Propionivibrio sp. TaxID=2212460 RepID=UPI003BF382DD
MKTQEEKALAAVIEYDRLMGAIYECRKAISNPANECDRVVGGDDPWQSHIPDGKQTHLAEVFAGYDDNDGFMPMHCHYDHSEAMEIIGECEGCRKTFDAIQERKRLKTSLGTIKRTIRSIARNSTKGGAA